MGVLLVDDQVEDQDVVNATLREAGFSVLSANDGLLGLDAAIAEKPELILLDSRIMGIDPIDFVKKVRRRSHLEHIPIILLTQEEEACDPLFFESIGVSSILNKPIDPERLSREVSHQIGQTFCSEQKSVTLPSEEGVGEGVGISNAVRTLEGDEPLRKQILETVEKIAWEVIPGVIETALPKETLQSIVERVVWETVPALAEIEIQKEIKRLQAAG